MRAAGFGFKSAVVRDFKRSFIVQSHAEMGGIWYNARHGDASVASAPMKDFDAWNQIKKATDAVLDESRPYFRDGEIWWVRLGLNVGYETYGKSSRVYAARSRPEEI